MYIKDSNAYGSPGDELEKLWRQFNTVRETLKHIREGHAIASIHVPGEYMIAMNEIFEDPNYIEKMAADLASYQIELAQQLSDMLQEIIKDDAAAVTQENIEPFPIGTPKADHRRNVSDTDDSK